MREETVKILLIEPDPAIVKKIREALTAAMGEDFNLVHLISPDDALGLLYMEPMDIILADVASPDPKNLKSVSRLIAAGQLVVALTDPRGTGAGIRALKQGAEDYVVKDSLQPDSLRRTICNAIERHRLRTERGEAQRKQMIELEKKAIADELTGLFNRSYIHQRLMNEIYRARRYMSALSIAMLDLDGFREINAQHGQAAGDEILKGTAEAIRETIRSVDIAARYGGEEFCVVMPETGAQGAMIFAERLRERIGKMKIQDPSGKTVNVTCSLGVAELDNELKDGLAFIGLAEEALLQAKKFGRNQSWLFKKAEPKPIG